MRLIRLFKKDLAKETQEWVANEIITISQAEQICQQYDIDYHQKDNHSFGYNLLIGLGYLFIGIALIILIGANWDDIPRAARMASVISLTMLTQALAIKKYLKDDGSTALFLLGNMFFGASIILIAQIYHLGEHMPDGVFWWALGCLPIGVLLRNPWLTLQSLLLALLWFYMEIKMGFYPLFFPLFIAGSIYVLYHGKQSIMLFLTVLISIASCFEFTLAHYWGNGHSYDFHIEHFPVSIALFLFTYTFSHWLRLKPSAKAKDYAALIAVWSLRFGLLLLLLMSFKYPWKDLIRDSWTYMSSMWLIISFISIATLLLAYKVNKLVPVAFIMPFYLVFLFIAQISENSNHAIYFQIIDNIVLIIVGIWLIIRGIHCGISHYFYLGVMTIMVTALMRYFDLIGSYIEGALLFAELADVLIGAAQFWKRNLSAEVSP